MSVYVGIQIDLRLKADTPQQVIAWLSMHTLGEGNIPAMNAMFTGENINFKNWKGGTIRQGGDDNPYWYLKINSSVSEETFDSEKLAFFLHEIHPFLVMGASEVLARTVTECDNTDEEIYWFDPEDTCIQRRRAASHSVERAAAHPKYWSKEALSCPLGIEEYHQKGTFSNYRKFNFRVNAKVGVRAEQKRILAKQYNERYTTTQADIDAAELAVMEKGE